jgi:hypothetical protein
MQLKAAGLWPNQPVFYIEDVFSTYLYTGNGTSQTITNGINLSGKGGLVWYKSRSSAVNNHGLFDTTRGVTKQLFSNTTGAEATFSGVTAFNTNGFTVGSDAGGNANGGTMASWTFREKAKFFDVVTYTGNGTAGRTVSHNLGSTPGCIIVKRTDGVASWATYHRSLGGTKYLTLNTTDASGTNNGAWNDTNPTDSVFTVGDGGFVNTNGATYVAYLFAHDAGGFGPTGADNVISCGSYVEATGPNLVNLGYEPQFLLIKKASSTSDWWLVDTMRGMTVAGQDALLRANTTAAELSSAGNWFPTSTGFGNDEAAGDGSTWIYIAIRRGPMAVPTVGTSVFGLNARTGTGANATVTGSAGVSDAVLVKNRGSAVASLFSSRLTGTGYLVTSSTAAEVAAGTTILQANPWDVMDGVKVGTTSTITNATSNTYINYLFDRAPSFFDEVCAQGNYNGLSTPGTPHNLGVKPELVIQKSRNNATTWNVVDWNPSSQRRLVLNTTAASDDISADLPQATSSVFYSYFNSTHNCVNYLFASCPGVSKVGSYTGTATTKQIDCGFTGGARFVLIKRTDSTGDWYVWDSARGIVSGNDPYLLLNSTDAEVTNTDYIDTYSAGFEISSTAPAAINASGGTFIFLAIA